ncbi:uncharacterized protein LOC103512535 [Diaphorina citri]|uniref:Uncharacterized protein LOC103512535 n=1 Tax=Diaphorina citri TaxID=121845 RepID=A0A1S3D6U3_DIACI|nr:uncharacterized protein LOC103512535 [Diaphorina citri]
MKSFVVIYLCCIITLTHGLPDVGANNNANKPQPGPNKPQPSPNKRPIPLWTSGKILTLLIVLCIVIGGLLFCCCFQFSCSVTIRNFTEENTALLNKPNKSSRKYESDTQLERWE